MKKYLYITSIFLGSAVISMQAGAISTNFIKRGFKHCTGYCDLANIKCDKGIIKQGYVDWCVKNCLHDNKNEYGEFERAIQKCNPRKLTPEQLAKVHPKGLAEQEEPTKKEYHIDVKTGIGKWVTVPRERD